MSGDEIVLESSLDLMEGDILIQKMPENYPLDEVKKVHKFLKDSLENNAQVITIGQGIELQKLTIKANVKL
ncbi:hypothetical protein ABE137_06790 [Brevibacillus laterosporus]|uniref:hypothetical protein n=1 Tax=Brevibacillus laterosporus TaxID=1465 RepID=UPI003D1D104C